MESFPPLSELAPFVTLLVVAGGAAGFLAGLFGVGGGALLVPVFYQTLGVLGVPDTVRMHVSVGTSLAIIIPTSLQSFRSHYKRGAVDVELLRSFTFAVPAGVVAASVIAAHVSGAGLRGIFALIAFAASMKLLFGRTSWKLGDQIPGGFARFSAGFATGLFSTLMGIGGGIFNNTFMTLYNRPMLQSVATSSGVGVLISIPGMLGYIWAGWGAADLPPFSAGFVNCVMAAMVIPLTLLAAPLGVRLAHVLPKRRLEVAFGIFLLLAATRFIVSLIE